MLSRVKSLECRAAALGASKIARRAAMSLPIPVGSHCGKMLRPEPDRQHQAGHARTAFRPAKTANAPVASDNTPLKEPISTGLDVIR